MARAANVEHAGETEWHRLAKTEVLHAARAAGRPAELEVSGQTPAGARWRADVLCTRGDYRRAFEVQRSGITLATLHARQAIYKASGVRAFWLMRTHERTLARAQPWQQDTPAVYVTEARRVPLLGLDLPAFTQAALRGRLTLFPALGQPVQLRLIAEPKRCFRCLEDFHLVQMVIVSSSQAPQGRLVVPGTQAGAAAWVSRLMGTELGPFVDWPAASPRTFHCPACGAPRAADPFGATWLDPAEPLTWSRRLTRTWERTISLPLAQHTWLVQAIGQLWARR
ncbi:hypothetical protein [Deinococcus soli (ex Cha et al. 2016)]|uniref:Competence protein CoiA nuclease-like domain-containing protein n=2 Tax=Deinococcus soli (ex Cha et al. 2016) TaxID=1309411 RepID=A0AAE3XFZ2_9DEIO|nr:hypothetical protein [Deinococcus soli (ex Cha et al. 2016)]MDR6221415.1 hypothetical protein [Deinococcus soli (ex Cha et al. 2016)]MDR6331416.1 hypothetical protein [Deinococcus soli (ex Cha et al. 2016)]MDR6754564.1 hypothetical protein [Deinococcus soli (ex Cha et al. 2016)]